jgi:hypothetical protein
MGKKEGEAGREERGTGALASLAIGGALVVLMTSVWTRLPISAGPMGSMGCLGRHLRMTQYGGGNPDRPTGTAWCGPACQVVWDSWLAE